METRVHRRLRRTGFSSLSQLAKLPVDTRKIDRSFVVEMTFEAAARSAQTA